MKLLGRRRDTFEISVQDLSIRVTAPGDLVDEARAATLTFWEQLQAWSLQHPEFRSKRPVTVPASAPQLIREIADASASAGVGPMFAARGAVLDHVGRLLQRQVSELTVECGGDLYVRSRKRSKLTVARRAAGEVISVVLDPRGGALGVSRTTGRGKGDRPGADALAVLAPTCMMADAASAGVQALLPKPEGLRRSLRYVEGLPGVIGALVVHAGNVGVAGAVEIAS